MKDRINPLIDHTGDFQVLDEAVVEFRFPGIVFRQQESLLDLVIERHAAVAVQRDGKYFEIIPEIGDQVVGDSLHTAEPGELVEYKKYVHTMFLKRSGILTTILSSNIAGLFHA